MLVLASILVDWATTAGGMAGSIAVIGFAFQVAPVLKGDDDVKIRRVTVVGGTVGLVIGVLIVLSASIW